jgi:hypothetical protein
MLTGRRLFETDDEIKTLERIKAGDVDPPSTINPGVPARLDEIVMRALAKDADDRYQDARELHADLLEFLYPASPDLTQQSLAHFMAELFSEETAQERSRLEEGTRLALALHEAQQSVELEEDWEEESPSSRTQAPAAPVPTPAPSRVPYAVAAVALLLAIATLTFFLTRPEPTPVAGNVPEEPAAPTTGAIQIHVGPVAGKATVDGAPAGEGADITIPNVVPGTEHIVRVEADGYTAYEEPITVAAGERVRLPVTLVATRPSGTTGAREPTREPVRAPSGGGAGGSEVNVAIAAFTSTPSGVDVYVDGKLVGHTPMEWDDGVAGNRYSVEYRENGYDTMRFTANLPRAGGRESFDRTLAEHAKADGKLSVNVSGGWADIFVDGKKIGQTPIFGYTLAAGTHEIRARRDDIGLDKTQSVTIKAGETAPVAFSAN